MAFVQHLDGCKCSNLFKKKKMHNLFPPKSCSLPFQGVDKHTFDILLYVIVT